MSKTGRYRVRHIHFMKMCNLTSTEQTVIYSGFTLYSLACGLISTITSKSHKVELVIFMLMAGAGAGQVCIHLYYPLFLVSCFIFYYRLDSTNIHGCSTSQRRQKGYVSRDCVQKCEYSLTYSSSQHSKFEILPISQFVRFLGGTLTLAVGSATM